MTYNVFSGMLNPTQSIRLPLTAVEMLLMGSAIQPAIEATVSQHSGDVFNYFWFPLVEMSGPKSLLLKAFENLT